MLIVWSCKKKLKFLLFEVKPLTFAALTWFTLHAFFSMHHQGSVKSVFAKCFQLISFPSLLGPFSFVARCCNKRASRCLIDTFTPLLFCSVCLHFKSPPSLQVYCRLESLNCAVWVVLMFYWTKKCHLSIFNAALIIDCNRSCEDEAAFINTRGILTRMLLCPAKQIYYT